MPVRSARRLGRNGATLGAAIGLAIGFVLGLVAAFITGAALHYGSWTGLFMIVCVAAGALGGMVAGGMLGLRPGAHRE